ncbi:MAG: hypothetical protein E7Z80_06675 [Methanobrevibacter thaueri]|nr:hypothetical protein [Methanobrevibacter thaueri]
MDWGVIIMILKSLKLKNFRIYKGSDDDGYERINFASGDKNITIIQGNNEVGKTTIMNALTWCLYNKEFYKKEGKKPLWNSFAADQLENGQEDFVEVSIEMEDESNHLVTFKRVLKFYKNDLGKVIRGNSTFEITEDDGINTREYLSTETYLNKHLPLKLRKYFLFNGEQLGKFFDLSTSGNIKDSVDQLSQLNLLNRLVSHLDSIETTHINKSKDLSPNLANIRNKIKTEENKCKNNQKNRDNAIKTKEELESKIKDLEDQISSIKGDPQELMNERKDKEDKLDKKIKKIKDNDKKYKKFLLDKFFYILGYESLNELQTIGEGLAIQNFIPADIKKSFLKQLLDNKICICGEPLEDGSDHYQHVLNLFNDTNPVTDIEEEVNTLLGSTKVHISDYPKNFKSDLANIKKDGKNLEKERKALNDRIVEIDNILDNMDAQNIIAIQNKLKSYRTSKETAIKESVSAELAINASKAELKKLYKDEKEELKKAGQYDENERRLKFIKNIKKISNSLRDEISEDMHNKLENATTDIFTEMHWKTIYDRVEIDENYLVTVFQKDGDINTANDLSDGGSLTLALAFTLALNSLSGFELPIVIDTPMGDLDEDIQMNIAGFLPSYSKEKQIALLVKSKEYTKEFRESVIDYVGNEYKLQFDGNNKGISRVRPWS